MDSRSIVWVTLESVRHDHTSLAGHERDTTPFLDRLARDPDGASFSNCVSHALWTRPSSTSILTGRAPSNHRVWTYEAALSEDVPTIPQQLTDRGYRTAAVSPIAQLSSATGLDAGFDDFHYLGKEQLLQEAGLTTMLRFLANVRRHSGGLTRDTTKHCRGFFSQEVAKRHIDRAANEDDPLFLYVHVGDSHHAYYPPKGWQRRFEDALDLPLDEALDVALDMSERLHEHIARGLPFDDAEWNAIETLYDTCVAYVDSVTEAIVERARERLDDPIIVVTADHGEFFGEEGLLAHMLVPHTAVTDVPLVVHGLDVPAGTEDGLVQPADAMAMLSAECGLDVDVPIGQDVRSNPREYAVTQRGSVRAEHKIDRFREHVPTFDAERYPVGEVTSVRNHDYRYQRDANGATLFSLDDQTVPIDDEPEVAERMDDALTTWLETYGRRTEGRERAAEFSQEMEQQLRDLGYR